MNPMVTYDKRLQAWYVKIRKGLSVKQVEIEKSSDLVILDLNVKDEVLGVEVVAFGKGKKK